MAEITWPWLALLLLGVAHGINPGMGWLFAVALGLQHRDRRAVWRALLPLGLGHALAIATVVLLSAALGLVLPLDHLRWIVAAGLVAFGIGQLRGHSHPRWGGMRVGARDLAIWSFLMATAHGAGLMALPFVFGATRSPPPAQARAEGEPHIHAVHDAVLARADLGSAASVGRDHIAHEVAEPAQARIHTASMAGHAEHGSMLLSALPDYQVVGVVATVIHGLGYLLITGLISVVVYEKVGLRMLRSVWLNLNLIWAAALIATAMLIVLL